MADVELKDDASALAALERFVVDNDDLLALEERIGRFNIFDALGIARAEIRHSNFLAWLLDPNESHGLGSLFLKAVLMELLKQAPPDMRPLSPIDLDGEELRGVEIRREWRHIDILITCEQPRFVIAIENKIDSGPQNPFEKYESVVNVEWADTHRMFVYLTPDGTELPEHGSWVPFSYRDLHGVLDRIRQSYRGAIGADVVAFLDHYLRLIGAHLMEDKNIAELCQRIYRNHRQALDLIYDHADTPSSEVLGRFEEVLRAEPHRWHVFNRTSRRIDFVPPSWLEWLPAIGTKMSIDKRFWFLLVVNSDDRLYWLSVEVWDTEDLAIRTKVIERLCQDRKEFGLRVWFLKPNSRWNRLYTARVAEFSDKDEIDADKMIAAFRKRIDELESRLAGVPDALRPIFEAWQKSQA